MEDRDFYTVTERDGVKMVAYRGFAWDTFNGDAERCRLIECDHSGDPLAEVLATGDPVAWAIRKCEKHGRWIADCTEERALELFNRFFGGKPGAYLPLTSLSTTTPCGDYWSEGWPKA